MVLVDSAGAGDIVSMAGLASPSIGHTVANAEVGHPFCGGGVNEYWSSFPVYSLSVYRTFQLPSIFLLSFHSHSC